VDIEHLTEEIRSGGAAEPDYEDYAWDRYAFDDDEYPGALRHRLLAKGVTPPARPQQARATKRDLLHHSRMAVPGQCCKHLGIA